MGCACVAFFLLLFEERDPWGLALFSHRSASRIFITQSAAVPRRRSPGMMVAGLMVGKSEPGRGLPPALSFKDVHHPCWEEGAPSLGLPPRGKRPAPSLSDRGRRASAVRGASSCRVSGSPA
jgi:hypothetical protein